LALGSLGPPVGAWRSSHGRRTTPSGCIPAGKPTIGAQAGADVCVDSLRKVPRYASCSFFDITVAESNARDLVIHAGPAISPPDEDSTGAWQFYLHPHQEDNLLALHGGRTFYLVNFGWNYPYHIVRLEAGGDILRIPPGTFHRSVSDPDGSVVLNQAVREQGASVVREFRVYNSRVIPRLFATTFKTAPLPKLHGVSW
jgi:hypothetical protein